MSENEIKVFVNAHDISDKIERGIHDKAVMLDVHRLLFEYCDPYVPQESGHMRENTLITPDYVHYNVPYAHYLYRGIKYSPSFKIKAKVGDEVVETFYTPAGTKQVASGTLNYNPSIAYPSLRDVYMNGAKPHTHPKPHPNATSYWDAKMMAINGEEFTEKIKEVIVKELNKNG